MNDISDFNGARKVALEHAREWFSLHAGQRMRSVYYFLVAAAFLFSAFIHSSITGNQALAFGVCLLGGFLSYIFYRMDNRVRGLIHAAEDAIKLLENELADVIHIPSVRIISRVDLPMPGSWAYSKVFRWLYASTGAAFLLGALFSIWNLASEIPTFTPAFYLTAQLLIGVILGILGIELLQIKAPEIARSKIRNFRDITNQIMGILILLTALLVLIHLVFLQLPSVIHIT